MYVCKRFGDKQESLRCSVTYCNYYTWAGELTANMLASQDILACVSHFISPSLFLFYMFLEFCSRHCVWKYTLFIHKFYNHDSCLITVCKPFLFHQRRLNKRGCSGSRYLKRSTRWRQPAIGSGANSWISLSKLSWFAASQSTKCSESVVKSPRFKCRCATAFTNYRVQ